MQSASDNKLAAGAISEIIQDGMRLVQIWEKLTGHGFFSAGY